MADRKNHKNKLAQRKTKLQHDKARAQKMQKEFIMNLIKAEQEKGLFNNNPTIPSAITDAIVIEGPSI